MKNKTNRRSIGQQIVPQYGHNDHNQLSLVPAPFAYHFDLIFQNLIKLFSRISASELNRDYAGQFGIQFNHQMNQLRWQFARPIRFNCQTPVKLNLESTNWQLRLNANCQ